jgi:ribosomal protein S18 acetylase RimI-like enzyme
VTSDADAVTLREYRPTDFDELWALDQQCFSSEIAYSREEFAYYLASKTAVCLVASAKKQTRGFILGDYGRRGVGHVITLDVDPGARRSGLGSRLMRTLEARFAEQGCRSVLLEVAVNNRAALTFYKAHGFSVTKTLRRYYPGGLDGLVMGKKIENRPEA